MEFTPVPPKVEALTTGRRSGLTKTMRIMNLTAIFLLTACLTASAHGFSQQVTLSEKNAPLPKVFKQIQKQTGFTFLYTQDMMKEAGTVTVELRNASLQEALKACLNGKGLSFEIIDQTVVIKKEADKLDENLPPPITIKGRIVNEDGQPVVASIVVKGTSNGTTSDNNGNFELTNVDENATLVITAVNIERLELKVNGKTEFSITVKMTSVEGEDVTVSTGYWTMNKKTSTGSIAKITSKDIEKQPINNPLQAMQGRMAGVYIQQAKGVAGGNFFIKIRGQNSIINGNDPLYVIDGVPFVSNSISSKNTSFSILPDGASPLSIINPEDIESIEVLKDADATAIYGSRGSNGVVLITTKTGNRSGKSQVELNFSQGIGRVGHKIDLLNTQKYLDMRKEAFINDGVPMPTIPTYGVYDLTSYDQNKYTDWQKEFIGGTANITNSSAVFSAGNENTQFRLGGTFYKETTVFPGDLSYKRGTGSFSLSHKSKDQRLHILVSSNLGWETNDLPQSDLAAYITIAPNSPSLFDINGDLNWENKTFFNPLSLLYRKYEAITDNTISNASVAYRILPGLEVKVSGGYTKMQRNESQINPLFATDPSYGYTLAKVKSSFANNRIQTWIAEPQMNYTKRVSKVVINFLLGSTFQKSNTQVDAYTGTGFSSDDLIGSLSSASSIKVDNFSRIQYNYAALYSRLNLDWDNKYIINLTARRDGSSRFGPDNRFSNFGAVGVAWIFSEERVIKDRLNFLSLGKLKASYGTSGNDQISDYRYYQTWSSSSLNPYQGSAVLMSNGPANSSLAWEENRKLEFQLDLGFFSNKLQISSSYYRNRSSNQLIYYNLPPSTGFSGIYENLQATIQNSGWEVEINSRIIKKNNFSWSAAFNISFPKNKLIEFPGLATSVYSSQYVIGKPLNIVKAFNYLGVDPQTGIYTFQDYNNDGFISYGDDQQIVKEVGQNFFGGFQNSIMFRNFEFDFLLQFVKQSGYTYLANSAPPGFFNVNQPLVVLDRWQKQGDITPVQKFTRGYADAYFAYYYYTNGGAIGDASFLRLKNVSISFELHNKILAQSKISKIKLYINAQNLLTITDFIGLDPESQRFAQLPPLRVFEAGVKLIF